MTDRENFLSIAKRTGYERMPVSFSMCPDLARRYEAYIREHPIEVPWDVDYLPGLSVTWTPPEVPVENVIAYIQACADYTK